MEILNKDKAYEMGLQARKEGLPSIPLYNKVFWEANMKNEHKKWRENIDAYATGWHDGGTQNVSKQICEW